MNCWAGSQNLLLEMPELYVGKLTRTVLRGKGGVTRQTTRSNGKTSFSNKKQEVSKCD